MSANIRRGEGGGKKSVKKFLRVRENATVTQIMSVIWDCPRVDDQG